MSEPQFPGPGSEAPLVRLPEPVPTFRRRAGRLRALSERGSATAPYLAFLAALADAQAEIAGRIDVPIVAGAGARPLDPIGLERTGAWREALVHLLARIDRAPMPDAARAAVDRLRAATAEEIESIAEDILEGSVKSADLAVAPFVAAGLQVYWAHLAARLNAQELAKRAGEGGCPACGSAPAGGEVTANDKRRYLSCSLCSTEWNLARIRCAACGSTAKISYFEVEGEGGAVKAETCDGCKAYVKLVYLEKDTEAEPHADDVATLPLDLLLAEKGYRRAGPNLLLATAS